MPSRLHRYDEPGHIHFLTISCYRRLQFFRHDNVKQVFVDGMHHTRAKLEIRWIAYVIMPEHVHLLVFPMVPGRDSPIAISSVLQHLKQYVGRHGKQALRSVWREAHSLGTQPLDTWARSPGAKPFWKTRGYDFNIMKEKPFRTKLDYIHKNPITRGLVNSSKEWAWSSYTYYENDDASKIAMDWDGSWPIL